MPGHPQLGNPVFGLDCVALTVADDQGNDQRVIQQNPPTGQTSNIKLSSTVTFGGIFANYLTGLRITFTIDYYANPMGGGAFGSVLLGSINVKTNPNQLTYTGAATQLTPSATSLIPGVYNLTAIVKFEGKPPVSAFAEGGYLEIYE